MRVIAVSDASLELVLETDLARLIGQLAAWWGNARFATLTPYAPMVIAAQEYATSWRTWEMKPYLTIDGWPIDAVRDTRYLSPHLTELCVDAVASLAQRDAYAAVVASLHWAALLERVRAVWPPDLEPTLADQRLLREHLVEAMWEEGAYRVEADAAHLARNAAALQTLDALATWLMSHPRPNDTLTLRAPAEEEEEADVRVCALLSDAVALEPYPFGANPLEVTWTVRVVPNCAYASQGEFLEYFFRSPQVQRRRTLLSAP